MQDRYQFVEHLGRGGFGKITLLDDTREKKKVIQKSLLNPTRDNCERLIRGQTIYVVTARTAYC